MGTRKPGHDHGFDGQCTPTCDAYPPDQPPRHNHPVIDPCTMNCPVATWGMLTNHETVHITGGSEFDKVVEDSVKFDAAPGKLFVIRNGVAVTEEAHLIVNTILPRLVEKFLRKNAQYARAQTGHDLGIKGIIPDINRKTAALITAVWDGGPIEGGDVDEAFDIAEDLVGHLLLMLAKMEDM